MSNKNLFEKYEKLKSCLAALGDAAVAFSGGTDSTLLLKVASDTLGRGVLAVTAHSAVFPERELREAREFCEREHIRQIILTYNIQKIENFTINDNKRCYYCKKYILTNIWSIARGHGISNVIEGSHTDDDSHYRPGAAAVAELGVASPFKLAGFSKEDIRALSKELGLPTYAKQSFACLASRIPYGEPITGKALDQIDRAEQYLLDLGLRQLRLRRHGNLARIETDEEGYALLADRARRELVYNKLREIGFAYSAIDLLGYRTGSMDEKIEKST